jgi:iron complex transport system ATP-binding protein
MAGEQHAIDLNGVGVRRGQRWILRDVDWIVPSGACAAILGPNGCGKSTLARVIAGHLWPTAGACIILGGRFGEADLPALRKSIRLVQPAGPYDVDATLTAIEVVETGFFGTLDLYHFPDAEMRRRATELLDQVGLARVADHVYSTLSSGERMRSLIARALASRPKLLLLDEPTAGLDLMAREQVLATVASLLAAEEHPTVVMITHHVEELPPQTTHALLLNDGQVAAKGSLAEVLRADVLSEVYRCPLEVAQAQGRYYVTVHPAAWAALLRTGKS